MKLDPTVMRTMNRQDYRVLSAVETGMRSHALVPSPLIASIASLRHGGTHKILSTLLRDKLLSHDRSCGYDGYRLTNSGYDILALHALKSRGLVAALGDRIGTGKESDVYLAATPAGKQIVLKFHRLGRTSFRDVKKKRDYFMVNAVSKSKKNGTVYKTQPNSWLFLSRMSALKEFAFMKALHGADYPTPAPLGHDRHIVAMGLVRGVPLYQLHSNRVSAAQSESIFAQSVDLASRLVRQGLVHCDLNEFNLMVDLSGIQSAIAGDDDVAEHYVRHSGMSVSSRGALSAHGPLQKYAVDGTGEVVTEAPPQPAELLGNGEARPIVTLIDFPQMVSTRHPNARELFERDVECLRRFFVKKLKCVPEGGWDDLVPSWEELIATSAGGCGGGGDSGEGRDGERDDDATAATTGTACLASRAQVRLDEELRASGYSAEDSSRDAELHYWTTAAGRAQQGGGGGGDGKGEKEEDDDDGDGDNDSDGDGEEEDDDEVEREDAIGGNEEEDAAAAKPDEGGVEGGGEEEKEGGGGGDDDDDDDGDDGLELDGDDIGGSVSASVVDASVVTRQTWEQAEEKARERVQRHLRDAKKKGGRKGAFRTKNSNKTFEKGKRVWTDHGY